MITSSKRRPLLAGHLRATSYSGPADRAAVPNHRELAGQTVLQGASWPMASQVRATGSQEEPQVVLRLLVATFFSVSSPFNIDTAVESGRDGRRDSVVCGSRASTLTS